MTMKLGGRRAGAAAVAPSAANPPITCLRPTVIVPPAPLIWGPWRRGPGLSSLPAKRSLRRAEAQGPGRSGRMRLGESGGAGTAPFDGELGLAEGEALQVVGAGLEL